MSFTLTEAEANLIVQALAVQPYQMVAVLIQKLQQQAAQQPPTPEPDK